MGHQVSAPVPVTAIAAMVSALLNNGMAIYEMGPVATALEKWIVEQFSSRLGFSKDSDGLLTSGGTLATLTALLAARQVMVKNNVWKNGSPGNLAIMIPEQAHYALDRSARIMGLGDDDIIKVPVDEGFQLRTDLLPVLLEKAQQKGKQVFAVAANSCSTATGVYDDLYAVGNFCKHNNLWFHVDAAHGGGVIFSEKHKHFLNGVEQADSVIIDLHKMLMNPALATMLIFKDGVNSYRTFNQDAHYLWEKNEDPEWFNYAKRTFECTKLMMSVKFYSILVEHGIEIFEENVDTLYGLATDFSEMIKNCDSFELAVSPMSNIVCFRLLSKSSDESNSELNSRIRRSILESGDFYIVQTELRGEVFLRTTLMNPFTTKMHLKELLDTIETIGANRE